MAICQTNNMTAIESGERLNSAWRYAPTPGFHDEMLVGPGAPRTHWRSLAGALNSLGPEGLEKRWTEGRRLLHDHGVTYNVYGEEATAGQAGGASRPWPLDPLPFLLDPAEWAKIEAAIVQRATLLDRVLADIYGPQTLLRSRKLPPELVLEHPGFLRPLWGAQPPGGRWLHSYAVDIARAPDGRWWVLSDRTQAPSGAGYALENRLVSLRVLPDVFRGGNVRRLAGYFHGWRDALRRLAPKAENPRIVLLTPGPLNETWFEHAFLARYLGFTLVEGGDLTVRNNRVFLKTLGGLLPVDVIVRRQDDTYCDPLELRPDSMLGVAGLVEAVRAGNVAVANALGSGVVESSAYSAFLPVLSQHILGEELKMPNIATWWCGDKVPREWVAEHLKTLVIKPASPAVTFEPVFGAKLTAAGRLELLEKIRANPGAYVAQEQVALSTIPVAHEGKLEPRHLVLRVFAAATSEGWAVMPGGLTRFTAGPDSLVVSVQRGGGSKDTWVLSNEPEPAFSLLRPVETGLEVNGATFDLPSRAADNLFWLGRYVERFEMSVRALRAAPPRLCQDADPASRAVLNVCQRVLSRAVHLDNQALPFALTERDVVELVAGEDDLAKQRFGLRSGVREIHRIAWLLRDVISTDAWRVLQQMEQQFSTAPATEPLMMNWAQDLLDRSVLSLAAFSGLATENMTRGHGWRFLDMGRRLERAVQIIQLIRRGLGFDVREVEAGLATALEIADCSLTYRSRYRNTMQADLVFDLLLLDEGNPRSAAWQFAKLFEHVEQLPESHPPAGHSREAKTALRMLTDTQLVEAGELAMADQDNRLARLDEFTFRLISDVTSLSDTLTRVYFTHAPQSRQISPR